MFNLLLNKKKFTIAQLATKEAQSSSKGRIKPKTVRTKMDPVRIRYQSTNLETTA